MEQPTNRSSVELSSVDLSTGLGYGLIYQAIIGQKPASINYPLPTRLHRNSIRRPAHPKRR